ncbi:hypothetical protein [uncultured Sphaerochaeta sp.]|uniref:hypothetical protein n=1 Tax=uncultured Sphaerochaeta sp. TaxID=886478 RepID=UPI0029CA357E|nr:hypothetical protein [uncultured Sphaerochaeta sp.]
MKQLRQGFLLFIFIILTSSLSAGALEMVESAIESSKTSYYEMAFPGPVFQEISSATVYAGSIELLLHDGSVALESSALFVPEGNSIQSFGGAEDYLTSSSFIKSVRPSYLLRSDEDAELFQSFLYLVDGNYFSEGYCNKGNTWYFVRDEFFGDVEVWIIETDEAGHISSATHEYDFQMELPELRGSMTPLHQVDQHEGCQTTESIMHYMEQTLFENLSYTLKAQAVENPILPQIWDGNWTKAWITTEEIDSDGYEYTSTLTIHAYETEEEVYLFGSIEAALGEPVVIGDMNPSFTLSGDKQASLFEQALDILLNDNAPEKYHTGQGDTWLFIRQEWFGEGMGFIVRTHEQGEILSLEYSYSIPLGEELVEEEPPFDPSSVDWTLTRVEPEKDSFRVMEGEGIPVTLEFDAYAANQMGSWMLTQLNDEFYGMSYDSAGLSSPYYDWISTDELPVGDHTFSYSLMEPGDIPLDTITFTVTVEPFDASGVDWNLRLVAPSSTSLNSPQGESIPLIVTFNDEATAQYGVNLALRHQGEIVGGESSRNLRSPFETMIPGSILTPGFHIVDVFLLPPGGADKAPLALKSITIRVF